jgi:hypothetical protein
MIKESCKSAHECKSGAKGGTLLRLIYWMGKDLRRNTITISFIKIVLTRNRLPVTRLSTDDTRYP